MTRRTEMGYPIINIVLEMLNIYVLRGADIEDIELQICWPKGNVRRLHDTSVFPLSSSVPTHGAHYLVFLLLA